jgi:iron complex transport system substrate-binding protein
MNIRLSRRSLLGVLPALLIALSACGGGLGTPTPTQATPTVSASPAATAAAFPVTIRDFQDRATVIKSRPERIVSIGPSNTEFLFALGAGDRVVGVDDFSNFPAEASSREKVGGVKVSLEKVVSLRPDLVVTVKFSDGTIEGIAASGIAVLVIDPQRLLDVPRTAVVLGTAIGADGQALASDIERKLEALRTRTASITPKPRVFHEVDASDPAKPFTVGPGSFIDELIVIAGGTNIAARTGSAYPQLSVEEIVSADPEVIVLGDSDYGVTAEQVAARPGWSGVTAVRTGRVMPISGDLVSRPGPRVVEAAELYAKLLHPVVFH